MKSIVFLLSLFLAHNAFAQTGSLKGKVTDPGNNPLPNVNISLSNTSLGTVTDPSGIYSLEGLPPGSHTLTYSMIGYNTLRVVTTVHAGRTTGIATVVLSPREEQLGEVVVEGQQINKFSRNTSVYVSKMPLSDLEYPQV